MHSFQLLKILHFLVHLGGSKNKFPFTEISLDSNEFRIMLSDHSWLSSFDSGVICSKISIPTRERKILIMSPRAFV